MASYKPSKIKRSSPCHRRRNFPRRGQHPGRIDLGGVANVVGISGAVAGTMKLSDHAVTSTS
jgi:hypothetical protein